MDGIAYPFVFIIPFGGMLLIFLMLFGLGRLFKAIGTRYNGRYLKMHDDNVDNKLAPFAALLFVVVSIAGFVCFGIVVKFGLIEIYKLYGAGMTIFLGIFMGLGFLPIAFHFDREERQLHRLRRDLLAAQQLYSPDPFHRSAEDAEELEVLPDRVDRS